MNDPVAALAMPRRRLSHWGRWVSAAFILALLVLLGFAFARGAIEWPVVADYFTAPNILRGVGNTVIITAASMVLGIVVGVIIAVLRLSRNPVASRFAAGYVWFFRGVPVLLQLLLWYNLALVFPTMGIPGVWEERTITIMTPFLATLLGLGLHQAAYTAEIVRGGILAVDPGQTEAAQSLALTGPVTLFRIVLPQAMRVIVPPMGNEVISTLKTSSLAAMVSFGELLQSAQLIYYSNNRIIELLVVVTVWYLIIVSLLAIGQYFIERRYGRGFAAVSRRRAIVTEGSEA